MTLELGLVREDQVEWALENLCDEVHLTQSSWHIGYLHFQQNVNSAGLIICFVSCYFMFLCSDRVFVPIL